jgi:hypothetical protein
MYPGSQDMKEQLDEFLWSLPEEEKKAFNHSLKKTRNLINFYSTTLDLDRLISPNRYKPHYYTCINKCYSSQRPEDIEALKFEPLQNCVQQCNKTKKLYKEKSNDVYYMSLTSYRNKMQRCVKKFDLNTDEFLDCEWTALNKIRRRYSNWWDKKLDEVIVKF